MNDNEENQGHSQSHGWSFGVSHSVSVSWTGPITENIEEQFERAKRRLMELKPGEMLIALQGDSFIDGDGI